MASGKLGYVVAASLALGVAATGSAQAAPNLILNGNFETVSAATTQSAQMTSTTAATVASSNVTGWYTQGYNFVFLANPLAVSGSQADTIGATNGVKLAGPGDGSANGLTISPAGGNFVAADNNYPVQPTPAANAISQTVTGLIVGQSYALSFYWAAAQQAGFTGATQEQWTVTFGSQTQATNTITLASQAFSGWFLQTMAFTATAATQTLSFLATGSPGGNPPFSLLDGVSLVAVPEPATWGLLLVGLAAITVSVRYGRRALRSGGSTAA